MKNNLRDVRKQKGMTTTELAKLSGVTRYTIYLIENSITQDVKWSTMTALANALGVPMDSIFSA